MSKSAAEVMAEINAAMKSPVLKMASADELRVEYIPTGIVPFDILLGGGLPRGRFTTIIGDFSTIKSLVGLKALAQVQAAGGVGALIDTEHAFDPEWAASLGVDVESLILQHPETGELAIDTAEALIRSGVDLIVFDSVAAALPASERKTRLHGESIQPARLAQLMSVAMRKLTAANSRTAILWVNQLRMNVGVTFGCLHADTRVLFTDGKSLPIRYVVENKVEGDVWSYDEAAQSYEPVPITGWHYNGKVGHDGFLTITSRSVGNKNGVFTITVTPDHKVLTTGGWKAAGQITPGVDLLTKSKSVVNGSVASFLSGVLVGDSYIEQSKQTTATLCLQDNGNPEYVAWKVQKLAGPFTFVRYEDSRGFVRYKSNPTHELANMKTAIGRRDPLSFFDHYSDLGLALWYMDDGTYHYHNSHDRVSISIGRCASDKAVLDAVLDGFRSVGLHGVTVGRGVIQFDKHNSDLLLERVARYVPDCMQYKLPERHRGLYEDFTLDFTERTEVVKSKVVSVSTASSRKMRQRGKYDITVANSQNYLAGGSYNGVVVHNSPEHATGGKSLPYFSSLIIHVRKTGKLTATRKAWDGSEWIDAKEVVGQKYKVTIEKSKLSAPYRDVHIVWDHRTGSVDEVGYLIASGLEAGIITRKGNAGWTYQSKTTMGREKFHAKITKDPDLRETLKREVYTFHGLPEPPRPPDDSPSPASSKSAT